MTQCRETFDKTTLQTRSISGMSDGPVTIPERPAHPSYAQPPIEEAIFDIRFAPSASWNGTIPGLIYGRLSKTYPQRPEDQQLQEATIEMGPNNDPPKVSMSRAGRLVLKSGTGRELVLIGENQLGVNDLRPYAGWSNLRPRIEEAINAYCSVAEPDGVVRLGVRYINLIPVPGATDMLLDFFTHAPRLDPTLGDSMRGFMLRTESFHEDGVRVNATLTDAQGPLGQSTVLLDLDVFHEWSSEEPLPILELGEWIADLREREYNGFEALITDKAREIFNSGED